MEPLSVDHEQESRDGGFELSLCPVLGQVIRLDRNRIEVELSGPGPAAQVTVSDLVAFPTANGILVGLIESVARQSSARSNDAHTQESAPAPVLLRVMPVGTIRVAEGGSVFTRGAAAYPHVGARCHLIDGEHLQAFMAILAEDVDPHERLVLGSYVRSREASAVADGNRLFQRHLAFVGSTGAGKSWAVALMLERAAQLRHANLIVFDLHGEYAPLTRPVSGREPVARLLRVAGPADLDRPSDDLLYLPYWLLQRDELMTLVLNHDDPHAADQIFRFTEHVQTLKKISLADSHREDALATFTVDSPVPYKLDSLIRALRQDDSERIPQHPSNRMEPGPYFRRLTGFVSRLEARLADPRYGFIFNPPAETCSYDWLTETAISLLEAGPAARGIKVVDLSEVPSAIVPLVVGVLARLIYNVQFWMEPSRRTPVCLVCEEAHLYLPEREAGNGVHRAALDAFEAIAKEGRKHAVTLLVVSQRPTDVSRTILSQCNNFIVMRLTNDHDRTMVERLLPETVASVVGTLPALEPGEAIVVGDALLLPTRIKFDSPAHVPASGTRPYWSLWAEQPSSAEAIRAGVEALQKQVRPRSS